MHKNLGSNNCLNTRSKLFVLYSYKTFYDINTILSAAIKLSPWLQLTTKRFCFILVSTYHACSIFDILRLV